MHPFNVYNNKAIKAFIAIQRAIATNYMGGCDFVRY